MVWIIFISLVGIWLMIDLGVFHKTAHVITNKEAFFWTAVWVSCAFLFSIAIYYIYEKGYVHSRENLTASQAVLKYITGYLVELSLSVDNIFVIAVIFNSLGIPRKSQHRVLFWGIIGAIIFRASMILFGVFLIQKIAWATYIFGAFLLYTAIKLLLHKHEEEFNPKKSFIYKKIRRVLPITTYIEGDRFFVKRRHILAATPLFIALVVIEFTDIVFALDSIPAILAITSDSFIVFSSNIMAILGLRSMYFFLANMLHRFSYLKYSLVVILSFVGIKLILAHEIHIPEWFSLLVIGISLLTGIVVSMRLKTAKIK